MTVVYILRKGWQPPKLLIFLAIFEYQQIEIPTLVVYCTQRQSWMKIVFYNLYQIIAAIALRTPNFCKSVAQRRGKLQTSRVTEQLN